MPRQSRKMSNTGIYHIILRGNERKNIFDDSEDKQKFLESIEEKQEEISFVLYAYCLMDNHVHLLLNTYNGDLASIMKGIAVRYASFYNWKYSRVGHVFQDRFKSEAVENERYLLAVVRYIHDNPVKAGIVSRPCDYQWSSFIDYSKSDRKTWLDTAFVLALFSNDRQIAIDEFRRFSMESDRSTFLDVKGDHARTLQEGKMYLEEYIHGKGMNIDIHQIKEDKKLRNEVIRELRSETNLSQRIIAQLLEIDKGIVERVKLE